MVLGMKRFLLALALALPAGCGDSARRAESNRPAKKTIEASKLPKAVVDSFEKNFPKRKIHDCFVRPYPDGRIHGYEIRWMNENGKLLEKEFGPEGAILDES
ncbi:MAG TPA: hypothetical protein VNC50_08780 [Planctomycetia bacterium]|nr:hypothetical protein [Planctomycetia bacterium]